MKSKEVSLNKNCYVFLIKKQLKPLVIIILAKIQLIVTMCETPCWVYTTSFLEGIEGQWVSATYWTSHTRQTAELRLRTVAEFLITVPHNCYLFFCPVYFSSHKLCLNILQKWFEFFLFSGLSIFIIGFLWTFALQAKFEMDSFSQGMIISDSYDLKILRNPTNLPSLLFD